MFPFLSSLGRFLSHSWRNLEVERSKVNLGAFTHDPVYFAVAHHGISRGEGGGLLMLEERIGRGPCRGPENWFSASGLSWGPWHAFGRDDADAVSRLSALAGALRPRERRDRSAGIARTRFVDLDLGVNFRAESPSGSSPHPSPRDTIPGPFLFLSLSLPSRVPFARLPLAFSLLRATGPREWPWKFNSPPSNGALPPPPPLLVCCTLSDSPASLSLCFPSLLHALFFSLPPPRRCVPSSLCVARWNLTLLRSFVASMHRVATLSSRLVKFYPEII